MDEELLRRLEEGRRALERATRVIGMDKITLAAQKAQALASTLTFNDSLASTITAGQEVLRNYERLSTNSTLVTETIASALARSAPLPDLTAPVFTNLQIAPPVITQFQIPPNPLVSTRIHELAHLNEAVSGAMSSIAWDKLAAMDRSLGRRLVSLSDSYRDIFAGLPKVDIPLPDFVTELPPRDMIVKSTIVSSRAVDFQPAHALIDLDHPAYARSDVDPMLANLDAGYVTMLDEAVDVTFGDSIGRVRHAAVSLRELCMHVLHDLAPDDTVRAWSQDPNHYHEGCPTRQARVLYICRHVNYGPYGRYLKKSVNATVAFFDALNGLHEVRPDVCDFQLRLMLTDAIAILRFLLRTAKYRP